MTRPTRWSTPPRLPATPRIGSMCTGYGGLDLAVQQVLGGQLTWVADPDPHIETILAARYPGVPNLGDITTIDWATVAPVDVITAGFPCQDISLAGRGAGITEGTRSGIWTHIAHAIGLPSPRLVLVETSPPSAPAASTSSTPTWPRAGSMHDGHAYAHPTSEPHTNGTGSSSPPGPPAAADTTPPDARRIRHGDRLLPTPQALDGNITAGACLADRQAARRQINLAHLLCCPHATHTPDASSPPPPAAAPRRAPAPPAPPPPATPGSAHCELL